MLAATSRILLRFSIRRSAWALALLFLLASAPAAVLAQTAVDPTGPGSDGTTTATAFRIAELGNLVWMQERAAANQTTGKYYALMNDIAATVTATWNDAATTTATLEGFRPIGTSAAPYRGFFDGTGHKISGLTINRPTTDYVGLFGSIGTNGVVRDLHLEGGAITGKNNVGGLAGFNSQGTLTSCTAAVAVAGAQSIGGLVGSNNSSGAITSCYATGAVSGSGSNVGGLVGYCFTGTVANSHATGAVTGDTQNLGGLLGANSTGSITDCYATGFVGGNSNWQNGGLVGSSSGTIRRCYATGAVLQGTYSGGLVGNNSGGTVSDCYATGAVMGGYGGGLAGANSGSITNCYSSGQVTGSPSGGGLIRSGSAATASYWDTQTSGQTVSVGGTGKATAQMKQQATFAGWDFSAVWGIEENQSYPYFQSSPPPFRLSISILGNGAVAVSPDLGVYDLGTVVTLTATPASGSIFVGWAGGGGDPQALSTTVTMDSPKSVTARFVPATEIRTLAELQAVAAGSMTQSYLLMNDIDASDTANWNDAATATDTLEGFQPIGAYSSPDTTSFRGIFEGNGHKITGLTINRPSTDYVGLFGYVGASAVVKNLGLEGGAVNGHDRVAGLAGGTANARISNCQVANAVGGHMYVGGLVGYNGNSAISDAYAAGTASASSSFIGGLAGYNSGTAATIRNCHATCVVNTSAAYVGGLVGFNSAGRVESSYATSDFAGSAAYVGGLIGTNTGTISNCYATGAVPRWASLGGLVGWNNGGTIATSYAVGTVALGSSGSGFGGLTGQNDGTVSACYWDVESSGQATSAGGSGKTTAAMETQGTYLPTGTGPAQWDFASVWGFHGGYPYLRTLPVCNLTYLAGANGSIDGATSQTQTVNQGGKGVAVTAIPDTLYHFSQWSDGSTANPRVDTNVTGDVDVTAQFLPDTLISTLAELQAIATRDLTGHYSLVNDIDASGTATWNDAATTTDTLEGFVPIGNSAAGFRGTFDGNGHKIAGLTIHRPGTDYVGLFGYVGTGGTVRDLGLEGGTVTGSDYTGSLVGYGSTASIDNCHSSCATTGHSYVGGLLGYGTVSSTITDCYAAGAVTGSNTVVGGLVGWNGNPGRIANSYALGAVMGYASVGGLVGINFINGAVATSYAAGAVTVSNPPGGGLVGLNNGTVTACYWNTGTSGQATSGGGTGKTTAQMKQQDTFLPTGTAAGQWDFSGIWCVEGAYPYLRASATRTLTYASGANGLVDGATSETQTVNVGARGVPVAAVGDTGYHFTHWSDGSTANPRTDSSVVADLVVVASFSNQYILAYAAGPGGSIDGATTQTVTYGGDGTEVTAVPGTGYHFAQWSDGVMTAARTDLNITVDVAVTAIFAINQYTLTYLAGANGSIAGATSQTLNHGADGAEVTAVPDMGYHFVQWNDDVMTAARTDRGVTGDITVTASFAINLYSLTYAAGPGGSLDGATSQTVAHGQSGTAVTANADAGWYFVDWSDGSTANPRTDANVTGDIAVTAHFRRYYEIRTLVELRTVATGDLDGHYTLMNDIDASDTANWNDAGTTTDTLEGFHPIGDLASPFRGVFDGAGHRITGLTCSPSSGSPAGLFGCIGAGAAVHDLGLEGGTVAGNDTVGALAATNFGTITECYAAVEVTGTGNYAGGLVGQNFGAISNAYAAGDVLGTADTVGGLVGSNASEGTVDKSYATGEVAGSGAVGGLAGETSGTVTDSYWDMNSTGQATSAGGTGEATAAMQQQPTFQPGGGSAAGDWDFAAVWGISTESGYPYLRAIETTATTRQVIVRQWSIPRGQQGDVPVVLVSQGNENSLSFSVEFDAAKLTFDDAVAGPDLPTGSTIGKDMSQPGKVGLLVGLPSGELFAAGNRDFVRLVFTAGSVLGDAAVSFRNAPAAKGIGGALGESLHARWIGGSVTVNDPLTGYEADVAPRPTGNGSLSAPDWTQMGRFVVGLDTPTTGSEFQRADCAPRATLGDGRLGATDWTLAGRYVVGSNPFTVAGGPTAPVSEASARASGKPPKTARSSAATVVSVGSETVQSSQQVIVPVNLQAQGTENALTFSLSFDPSQLTYVSAQRGAGVPAAATFTINEAEAAQGRLGVLIGNGTDSFTAGTMALMQVTFAAATVSAEAVAQVQFCDTPALREVSDMAANALGTTWTDGSVTIAPGSSQTGDFLTRRVKSSHSEKWDSKGAQVVGKDSYSFSAKMQLPAGSLAAISNATTLTLVLGDAVTSGAACEVFERPLSAATKSTLAGHPTAKRPKDPTRGGSVSFVELQPNSKKKARVVTIKWTKTGVLTATVVGAPAPANWDPANPAEHRKVENIADLCDGAEWPEGVATGVAVPTLVNLSGVFIGADTVACGGKKSVKSSDGGDLVGWSVSGK